MARISLPRDTKLNAGQEILLFIVKYFKRRTETVYELYGFYEFIGSRAKIVNYSDKGQGLIPSTGNFFYK